MAFYIDVIQVDTTDRDATNSNSNRSPDRGPAVGALARPPPGAARLRGVLLLLLLQLQLLVLLLLLLQILLLLLIIIIIMIITVRLRGGRGPAARAPAGEGDGGGGWGAQCKFSTIQCRFSWFWCKFHDLYVNFMLSLKSWAITLNYWTTYVLKGVRNGYKLLQARRFRSSSPRSWRVHGRPDYCCCH